MNPESPASRSPRESPRWAGVHLLVLGAIFSFLLRKIWSLAPLQADWRSDGTFHFFGHAWRAFDFPTWYAAVFFAFFLAPRLLRFMGVPLDSRAYTKHDLIHLSLFPIVMALVFWRPDFPLKIWMGTAYISTVAFRTACLVGLLIRALPQCFRPGSLKFAVWLLFFLAGGLWAPWQAEVRWAVGDEPSYLMWTASLLKDGDFDVENNILAGDYQEFIDTHEDALTKMRGDTGARHPRTYSTLMAPGYLLGGRLGVMVEQCILQALAGLFLFLLVLDLTRSHPIALATSSILLFSYPLSQVVFYAYPETVGMMLTAGMLLILLRPHSVSRSLIGAVLAGLMLLVKARYAVLGIPFYGVIAYRMFRYEKRAWLKILLLLPLPVLGVGLWSSLAPYRDGPGLWYGIQRIAAKFKPGAWHGGLGETQYPWLPHPFYHDAWSHWLAQAHGLLLYSPIYLLTLCGLRPFFRERRRQATLLALLGAFPLAFLLHRGSNTGWAPAGRFLVYFLPLAAPWMALGLQSLVQAGRYTLPVLLGGWTMFVSLVVGIAPETCLPNYWDFGVTDLGCSNHFLAMLDTIGFPLRLYKLWPGFCFVHEMNLVIPMAFTLLALWLVFRSPRQEGGRYPEHEGWPPKAPSPNPPSGTDAWSKIGLGSLWACSGVLIYILVGNTLVGGGERRYNLAAQLKDGVASYRDEWFSWRDKADRQSWAVRGNMLNGPYLTLGPGRYVVRYGLIVESLEGCSLTLKVVSRGERLHAERSICADQVLQAKNDPHHKIRDFYFEFELDGEYPEIEFRAYGDVGADVLVYRVETFPINTFPSRLHYRVGRWDERLGLKRIALRRYLVAYEMGRRGDGIEERIVWLLRSLSPDPKEQLGIWQELDPDPALFSFLKIDRVAKTISAD
ncbi:MAG: hypothetical protein HYT87_04145 [Nitrospirae bacterium]|nr:hypothetical protein [Nitrospirota bacterium]